MVKQLITKVNKMAQKHNSITEQPMTVFGSPSNPTQRSLRYRFASYPADVWQAKNPLLQMGEIGIEIDTFRVKVGNGVTLWDNLEYAVKPSKWGELTGDINAQTDLVNLVDDSIRTKSVNIIPLSGNFLVRVINGTTSVTKSLFPTGTVFIPNKTLIFDDNGTVGIYVSDIDSANINVQTITISPLGSDEPTLLGNVATHADLPLIVSDAELVFGRTPHIDDYARVISDETMSGHTVEWYISNIDSSANITWANPIIINTSDYQAQTTSGDAGKILTGGATPGTFGTSLSIDPEPTENSTNMVSSGAVFDAIKNMDSAGLSDTGVLYPPVTANNQYIDLFTIDTGVQNNGRYTFQVNAKFNTYTIIDLVSFNVNNGVVENFDASSIISNSSTSVSFSTTRFRYEKIGNIITVKLTTSGYLATNLTPSIQILYTDVPELTINGITIGTATGTTVASFVIVNKNIADVLYMPKLRTSITTIANFNGMFTSSGAYECASTVTAVQALMPTTANWRYFSLQSSSGNFGGGTVLAFNVDNGDMFTYTGVYTNVTPASWKQLNNPTPVDYLIEKHEELDGSLWWKKYASGWVEIGGRQAGGSTLSGVVVDFSTRTGIVMKNGLYFVQTTPIHLSNNTTVSAKVLENSQNSQTFTVVTTYTTGSESGFTSKEFYWEIKGKSILHP